VASTEQQTIILTPIQIKRKLERIAYEILENNHDEKEIFFIGIRERGTKIAKKIAAVIGKISELKIEVVRVELNKQAPLEDDIAFNKKAIEFDKKVVVLIDDVANTGRTMCYAIKPLLNYIPKKIEVAVLIDRDHKAFPVTADYIGLTLSTFIQDHIYVELESGKEKVYLV
jgi:pyrimidine operon attenuation protein/uracil phosphoribosyltransferase